MLRVLVSACVLAVAASADPNLVFENDSGDKCTFTFDGSKVLSSCKVVDASECDACAEIAALKKWKETVDKKLLDLSTNAPTQAPTRNPTHSPTAPPTMPKTYTGDWQLATRSYLSATNAAKGGKWQYKYYQPGSGRYYLTPATTLKWSWDRQNAGGNGLCGTYQQCHSYGSCSSFHIRGSGEKPRWGLGCGNGGGAQVKVLPYYHQNANAGTCTVCQDRPGIFGGACAHNIEIYAKCISGSCLGGVKDGKFFEI
eukprot:g1328.t1